MRNIILLESEWLECLSAEFAKPYMQQLKTFLQTRRAAGATIYPAGNQYFAAFNHTPLSQVKVVILGQDPYHGINQAHGLSFSVPHGQKIPPSLLNIDKELHTDLGLAMAKHGDLSIWAKQGVLLLNSVLTVEAGLAAAHQGRGWETFTDVVIRHINAQKQGVVFMLWGNYAHKKGALIDRQRHLVLEAAHPSPLSAHRGFFGCKHFSICNGYLVAQHQRPVNWAR